MIRAGTGKKQGATEHVRGSSTQTSHGQECFLTKSELVLRLKKKMKRQTSEREGKGIR